MNIKKVWNSLWCFSPYYHKPIIKFTADILFDVLQFLSYEECKNNVFLSKSFSRIALQRMRQQACKLLKVEVYMRCIYSPEELDQVVAIGEAVAILKVYRGPKEKLSGECIKAYVTAIDRFHTERQISTYAGSPIRYVTDFCPQNTNNMAYHMYFQGKQFSEAS
uniref:Uncharacterized protein n=1 Tax=Ditylenchus dipsaci TaxID=166011 RepID=A0A915DZ56_9BILA